MTDRITPEHRSWNMSRIKGKDTKNRSESKKLAVFQGIQIQKE